MRYLRSSGFVSLYLLFLVGMTWGCAEGEHRKDIADQMRDAQTVTYGSATAHYSKGLDEQARCFAGTVDAQLSYIQSFTGYEFQSVFRKCDVYLKLLGPNESSKSFFCHGGEQPLLVDPNKTSCADIVEKNDLDYPFAWAHELVEGSLCWGKYAGTTPRLLLDGNQPAPGGKATDNVNYTRWFREGFASYCGILACRAADLNQGPGRGKIRSEMLDRKQDLAPFSSLAMVGKRLFAWWQYDDYADFVPDPNLPKGSVPEAIHYDAALGLFLLIEARYGQRAIKEIIHEVNRLQNGTGEDLKRIVSKAIGTDVVGLVEGFRFPNVGMTLSPAYRPFVASADVPIKDGLLADVADNSPAQRAGIKTADIVLSLDGEPTLRHFDFECALYKHMQQKTVRIGIRRKGAGPTSVEMVEMKLGD